MRIFRLTIQKRFIWLLLLTSFSFELSAQRQWVEYDESAYTPGSQIVTTPVATTRTSTNFANQITAPWYNDHVLEDAFTEVILFIDYDQLFDVSTTSTTYTVEFDAQLKTVADNGFGAMLLSASTSSQPGQSLTVEIDNTPGAKVSDKVVLRFDNSLYININVTNVMINGAVSTSLPSHCQIVTRAYWKKYTVPATTFNVDLNSMSTSSTRENAESIYELDWGAAISGAEWYEVEWTFIDFCDVNENCDDPSSPASVIPYDFRHNSSRIITKDASTVQEIAALYSKGYIIWRVRPVGYDISNPSDPEYPFSLIKGGWSIAESGTADLSGSALGREVLEITSNLDEDRTWQASMTFAENGLHKEVVNYMDHTMRSRQTITKINTPFEQSAGVFVNPVVVTQTIYDYEGRPAIQTLPTPVQYHPDGAENFAYKTNFNVPDGGTSAYSWEEFDKSQSCEGTVTEPMDDAYGSAYYYSDATHSYPNDRFESTDHQFNNYIPDAQGFPFAQVEYTPDNTGRILRQGGVGFTHQLSGSTQATGGTAFPGHETQFQYTQPQQGELDFLFGSEIGDHKHYEKRIVTDPNGQISIAIVDAQGRVIATSLDGDAPNNVDELSSVNPTRSFASTIHNNFAQGGSMEFTETFYVSKAASYEISYEMSIDPYDLGCTTGQFCFDCKYELLISVMDDCDNQLIKNADPQNSIETISLRVPVQLTIEQDPQAPSCTALSFKRIDESGSSTLDLGNLSPGKYTIKKVLRPLYDDLEAKVDQYIAQNQSDGCILELSDFLPDASQVDVSNCDDDHCAQCYQLVSDKYDEFNASGGVDAGEQEILDELTEKCNIICKPITPCQSLYLQMLQDVTIGGQYAPYFVENSDGTITYDFPDFDNLGYSVLETVGSTTPWRSPETPDGDLFYPDEYGEQDYVLYLGDLQELDVPGEVYDETGTLISTPSSYKGDFYVKPSNLSLEDFIQYWRPSWAEALVTYHPEYCYYTACLTIEPTYLFDQEIMATENSEDAINKGLFDPFEGDYDIGTSDVTTPSKYLCPGGCAGRVDNEADFYASVSSAIQSDIEATLAPKLENYVDSKSIWEYSEDISGTDNCVNNENWNIYKGLYIDAKYKFYEEYYDNSSGCTFSLTEGNTRRFIYKRTQAFDNLPVNDDLKTEITSTAPNYKGMKTMVEDQGLDVCMDRCAMNARRWRGQLEKCTSASTELDLLINELVAICQGGCMNDPILASTKSPYRTKNGNQTFKDAFTWWSDYTGISLSLDCIGEVLDYPPSEQTFLAMNELALADSCTCDFLSQVQSEFAAYQTQNPGYNCSVQSYFEEFYPQYNLDFDELNCYCIYLNDSSSAGCEQSYRDQLFVNDERCYRGVNNNGRTLESFINALKMKYSGQTIIVPTSDSFGSEPLIVALSNFSSIPISSTPPNVFIPPTDTAIDMMDIFPGFYESGLYSGSYDTLCPLTVTMSAVTTDTNDGWPVFDIAITDGCGFNCTFSADQEGVGEVWLFDGYYDVYLGYDEASMEYSFMPAKSVGLLATQPFTSSFSDDFRAELSDNCFDIYCCNDTAGVSSNWGEYLYGTMRDEGSEFLWFLPNQAVPEVTPEFPLGTGPFNSLEWPELFEYYKDNFGKPNCPPFDFNLSSSYKNDPNYPVSYIHVEIDDTCAGTCSFTMECGFYPLGVNWEPDPDSVLYGVVEGDVYYAVTSSCQPDTCAKSLEPISVPMDLTCSKCLECDSIHAWKEEFNDMLNSDYGININNTNFDTVYGPTTYFKLLTNYLNNKRGTNLHYLDVQSLWVDCYELDSTDIFEFSATLPEPPPTVDDLCESNPIPSDSCEEIRIRMVQTAAYYRYQRYVDEKKNDFIAAYKYHCENNVSETFNLIYPNFQHHFTLYYYDMAGSLVKTVPPAGVNESTGAQSLETFYEYNTLGMVKKQMTPDGGTTEFWYDALGRIVASQNAQQASQTTPEFSYTLYDELSRIVEVGQIATSTAMTDAKAADQTQFDSWISGGTRTEVTKSVYDGFDDLPAGVLSAFASTPQYNTNRLVSVVYQGSYSSGVSTYDNATHYNYDIHGNVKEVIQEISGLTSVSSAHQYSNIEYDYDLVSGDVKKVYYRPEEEDAFIHKYDYDEDNRIAQVYTSQDDIHWTQEADYEYYLHGPLARNEIGEWKVQGIDYAYTIHGWLKGVNSEVMDENRDIGQDGQLSGNHQKITRDAYGFGLHYYGGDYQSIATLTASTYCLATESSQLGINVSELYNGNISSMVTVLPDNSVYDAANNWTITAESQAMAYGYDQLNRITKVFMWAVDESTNTWDNMPVNDYKATYSYDPNGNIETLQRWSPNGLMDDFEYHYTSGTNQLDYVDDLQTTTTLETGDIEAGQTTGNFSYDNIGNLVSDVDEDISAIAWTVYGKIEQIVYGSGKQIDFEYSASGQRICKSVTQSGTTVKTWYIRDAGGNVMAIYSEAASELTWGSSPIYGSSRLGMFTPDLLLNTSPPPSDETEFTRGNRLYELSNHLGNVLAVVSDRKIGENGTTIGAWSWFEAEYYSFTDYYPFGMEMEARSFSRETYRYGFNGQEKDDEVKGSGNSIAFEYRVYDSRIGRWSTVDKAAICQPGQSPYKSMMNNPNLFVDPNGNTEYAIHIRQDAETGEYFTVKIDIIDENSIATDANIHWYAPMDTEYEYYFYYDWATVTYDVIDKDGNITSTETKKVLLTENGIKDMDAVVYSSKPDKFETKKEYFFSWNIPDLASDGGRSRSIGLVIKGGASGSNPVGQDFSDNVIGEISLADIELVMSVVGSPIQRGYRPGQYSWETLPSADLKSFVSRMEKRRQSLESSSEIAKDDIVFCNYCTQLFEYKDDEWVAIPRGQAKGIVADKEVETHADLPKFESEKE